MAERRVAVVGGGITGLAAAWELERSGVDVVVFESAELAGGKLSRSDVPGLPFPLDDGADAFLTRVPDALELCDELAIDDLVHPASNRAFVHARRELRPLPAAHLLGIPTDLDDLAATGLVSDHALDEVRADLDSMAPPPEHDESIGALVRRHLGDEVCDHIVGPLVGGINAGEVDQLSAAAAAPQIWACAQRGGSLVRAAADARSSVDTGGPVFATPREGMATLVDRLVERLDGEIRLRTPAPSIRADAARLVLGDERFDGVVLAAPAPVSGRLLAPIAPEAADLLGGIEYASVVMVTLVARASAVEHSLDGSGFLVSRTSDTDITACSWGSSKWPHWDDGEHVVFRISIGHDADPVDWCAQDDAALVATALGGLHTTMGTEIEPTGSRVSRWPDSLPQYRPGHLDLVARIHDSVAEAGPVAVAGAGLEGLGVPACIRQGRAAARALLG